MKEARKREIDETVELFDMELFFDREGIAYKHTRGRSGEQLNVKTCPFCGDERWRVYVNADTGAGNCFVCDTKFGKTKFVKEALGTDSWRVVNDTIREVAREAGWRPKRRVETAVNLERPAIRLPAGFPLPTPDGENLVYLEDRGITGEIARYFHLSFCGIDFWPIKKEDGSTYLKRIENRVIIPVFDLEGNVVTFQGRDVTGTAKDKYWFPPGLPGTGLYLLNAHNALRFKEVVVGEGAFDVAALKMALDDDVGLRHIVPVGTFGKHLSYGDFNGNDQLGAFVKLRDLGLETVTICWDGETKALEAALAAARRLRGIGLGARIALLPKGKDPNEVEKGVVQKAVREAVTYSPAMHTRIILRNPYK